MDESTWQAKLAGIQIIYDFCAAREIYNSRATIFAEEFRKIVHSLPDVRGLEMKKVKVSLILGYNCLVWSEC